MGESAGACCGTCHWFERVLDRSGFCRAPLPIWVMDLRTPLVNALAGAGCPVWISSARREEMRA
jgi:hypothetical protein